MGPLLALASAVCYGIVDFTGGLLSRRAHFAAVTVLGQVGGLLLATAAALLFPADVVRPADLLWGALSGVGSGAAMHFLNRGLSHGAMSVVVPVSAVTGVGLSVVCGVLLGDRPTAVAWWGIALSVPALWMVCGGGADGGGGVPDGLPASAGVALQYIALAQAGAAGGLWPVAAGRVAAVLVLLPAVARNPRRLRLPPVRAAQAVLVGAGAALGLLLHLLAAQRQLLAVAVVLASRYPALPVILGLVLLHERLSRKQVVGLAGAGVATVLLSPG
ncbi:multidrug DMT transporter permease [Streptomyces canus]|uniref:Multidrug DMT transporter permease n=1 Tax=Streptomyces canus TaxID=58343 RepID=A0A101SIR0_9ACTN|nr:MULTISPECIES: EamA family transporter [Streptomyces]KUN74676.1 multidrug DMT transporter permease [Streptomyces canus]MDI5909940.1 EamA family transporter [Streptomyces sp. 12257]